MLRNLWKASVLAFVVGVIVGCDDGLSTVEGTVTFNGEPVSRGSINFEPADESGVPAGANVEGGKFRIEKVQRGEKIVRIHAVKVIGTEKKFPEMGEESPVLEITEDLIPLKYNFQSELKVNVKDKFEEHNFDLEPQ